MNIAIFASGNGSNFENIVLATRDKKIGGKITIMLTDNPNAYVLERAKALGIKSVVLNPVAHAYKFEYEKLMLETLASYHIDVIVLAGYMRILSPAIVREYEGRILNIHPSLLPKYKGKNSIEKAFNKGEKESGATVHFVDEGIDTGKIIVQEAVAIDPKWSLEDLEEEIHEVEHRIYPVAIAKVVEELLAKKYDSYVNTPKKKRALISVSDKTGIVEFARGLVELDFEIISTGGTKASLEAAGVPTISISDITGFPEIMDGRVKTLHPNVHGALLCVRDNLEHRAALIDNQIGFIDLVAVNLYPFKETLAKGLPHNTIIENIDIGGPSMLRSGAKNYQYIPVVVDAADYEKVLAELRSGESTTLETRERLAAKVFRHTAAYDAIIADYLTVKTGEKFPETYTATFEKAQDLRYGENPHQQAAFYKATAVGYSLANAKQLHGKELSYNNIQDANAAIDILAEFKSPCVVALKHMNPCGVGLGKDIGEAWDKAYESDPVSIFGGIVSANCEVTEAVAAKMGEIFLEVIIAPSYSEKAFEILAAKKNIRLLTLDIGQEVKNRLRLTNVNDGVLLQDGDFESASQENLKVVTKRAPTAEELEQLIIAQKIVKHVKSNAITLVRDNMSVGVGAGQMNRVGAAKIAIEQAGEKSKGAVLGSDAFFPMPDTVQAAIEAGVIAIIQPGGSIKDNLSIELCDAHNIAMVFTGARHFKH